MNDKSPHQIILTPPTPEWLAKHGGNVTTGGGRMTAKVNQLKYTSHFDILHHEDALPHDYSSTFGLFCYAHYVYLSSQKALTGSRGDTSETGEEGGIPLSDLYIALMNRFAEHKRHCYRHGAKAEDHWKTLAMLEEPLPEGANIRATKAYMFALVPQVSTALDLLEDYSQTIQREFRRAKAAEDTRDRQC